MVRNHRFLFIGGVHRSGTSPVFRCLREHPMISGFRDTGVSKDEGQLLQSVYPPANAHGGVGKFGFHPEAHLTERSALAADDNRARLFAEWGKYWNLEKPVLIEKSPPNVIRTRFLQEMFPNSYFVVVIRDPIAVSYATRDWTGAPLERLIEHWLLCHESFERDRKRVRRLLVLRYEDFTEDPQATLEELYSFLGLPGHPNRIEVHKKVNEEYMERWRGEDNASGIIRRFERRVAAFGYSLDV
ncbi:MAG: sulfotransferase family protein [Rubrobacteraceae bacterium]